MSFSQYLTKLAPSIETLTIKRGLDNMIKDVTKQSRPAVDALATVFNGSYKWQNEDVKAIDNYITKSHRLKLNLRNPNSIELQAHILDMMQETLPLVRTMVDGAFGRDVSNSGLTYSKTNLLQWVETAQFTLRYIRVWVNYVSAVELAKLEGGRAGGKIKGAGPDDHVWLKKHMVTFVQATDVMGLSAKDLKAKFNDIPDMLVDPTNEEAASMLCGAGKMNPFGFADMPFPISVIYKFRLNSTDKDVDEYQDAVATAKVVEHRVLLLQERIKNGQGDAATEKMLEVQEERLMKVRRNIARMEEEYGL